MTELKRCPFCKGKAVPGNNEHGYWIGCVNPNCFVQTRYFWTEKEAVQAWNTRAEDEEKQSCSTCKHCNFPGCDFGWGYICKGEKWEPKEEINN